MLAGSHYLLLRSLCNLQQAWLEIAYFWQSNGNQYLIRNTRNNSDFHAGTWPRENVHGMQSSRMEFEPQQGCVVVCGRGHDTRCYNISVVMRRFGSYESSSSARTARVVCIHEGSEIRSCSLHRPHQGFWHSHAVASPGQIWIPSTFSYHLTGNPYWYKCPRRARRNVEEFWC